MSLGLIASALAGGAEGAGNAAAYLGKTWNEADLKEQQAQADALRQKSLAEWQAKLQQQTHAANADTDISNTGRRMEAETAGLTEREKSLRPGLLATEQGRSDIRVGEHEKTGAIDTQQKVDEFVKLEPLKRKAMIDTEVEKVRAMATPEMLKATRAEALAKHIVDPSYTLVPNADGTVTTFDTHSGKSAGALKDEDGAPIIRKDPEEMKAATSVINMANGNLRIAEAAYKASVADPMLDPAAKAAAAAEWKGAQIEARRLSAPAYAVLYSKAGIEDRSKGDGAAPAPYSDGTELRGKDGQIYVVQGGQPVLKSQAGAARVPEDRPHTRGLINAPTIDDIPPPPASQSPRNPAYTEWRAQYGEAWDRLTPRSQQQILQGR